MDVFTDEQRAALQDIVKDAVAESIETYLIDEEGTYYGWPQKAGEWLKHIAGKGVGVADRGLQSVGRGVLRGHRTLLRKTAASAWKGLPVDDIETKKILLHARRTGMANNRRWMADKEVTRKIGATTLGMAGHHLDLELE